MLEDCCTSNSDDRMSCEAMLSSIYNEFGKYLIALLKLWILLSLFAWIERFKCGIVVIYGYLNHFSSFSS